jgi:WD40 repeat protein
MNDDLATLKMRFEPKEGQILKRSRQLNAVRFTSCGRFLLAAGHDGLIHRFDATNAELPELKPLTGHNGWVQRLAIPVTRADTPAGDVFFSADSWGRLRCSSFIDETAAARWAHPNAHDGWILDLALSPSGKLIASCGIDRVVRIWSTWGGTKLHEFTNPEWEVLSVLFAPDEASIVAGDLSGMVRQWDLTTGKVTREFSATSLHKTDRLQEVGGVRRMAFSLDGKRLLCAGTKPKGGGNVQGIPAIMIFDWETGIVSKEMELGNEGDVYVTDMMFHPDAFLIVTISGNPGVGKLLFQRLEDEAPFFETTKMPNCHSVALHPDRQQLAVVATNGGSNGNGRSLDKDGKYPGNFSPIHLWKLPLGVSS